MKIELDENSVKVIVDYIKNNPDDLHKLIKIIGTEMLSVLKNEEILKEGAILYRNIQRVINESYKKY